MDRVAPKPVSRRPEDADRYLVGRGAPAGGNERTTLQPPERDRDAAPGSESVSVVIPAYNEGEMVGSVVEAVTRVLRGLGGTFEIVVVDDGSHDDTAARAEAAGARVVRHQAQKGYGAAIKTGVRHTSGDVVVLVDGDGQHDPD